MDIFSVLIPIFFIIYYWKQPNSKTGLKILLFYCIISFIINSLIEIFGDLKPFWVLYTGVETLTFISFLYVQLKNNAVKAAARLTSIAFILFIILYAILAHEKKKIDSIPIGIESIIIIILSYYFLYEKMNDTTTLYIYSTFPFWVVVGMVLYLSGSFFIYLFAGFLSKEEVDKFWFVTNIFSIIKTIFFTVAIILNTNPSQRFSMSELRLGNQN